MPFHDSRKPVLVRVWSAGCQGRSAPSHGRLTLILRGAVWGPLGHGERQGLSTGAGPRTRRWVMCDIPLDLQRRFEQRWAARFSRPNPLTTPEKHELEREDLDRLSEVIPEAAKPTIL